MEFTCQINVGDKVNTGYFQEQWYNSLKSAYILNYFKYINNNNNNNINLNI